MLLKRENSAAVLPLCDLLADEDRSIRILTAQALGKFADRRAVEPLIAALFEEKFWDVRDEIVEALRLIGDPKAVNELILLLENDKDDLSLKQFTAWALKKFGWEQLSGEQQASVCILRDEWDGVVPLGGVAVKPLVNAVRNGTQHVRRIAADSLGKIGDVAAISALVALLNDEDSGIRKAAAAAVVQVAKDRDDADLQTKALIALEQWSAISSIGPSAFNEVFEATKSSDVAVRQQAIRALGMVSGTPAIKALMKYLRSSDTLIRRAAAEGLERAKEPKTIPVLVAVLTDDDTEVRHSAARALRKVEWNPTNREQHIALAVAGQEWMEAAKLGQAALAPLMNAFQDASHRPKVMGALVELGDLAVDPLVELLATDDDGPGGSSLRLTTVETLGKIGHRKAIPALEKMMGDPELAIRRAAVDSLRHLGWVPANALAQADMAIAIEDWTKLLQIGAPAFPRMMDLLQDDARAGQACRVIEKLLAGDDAKQVSPEYLHALAGMTTAPTRAGGIQGRHASGGKTLNATVAKRRLTQLARSELKRRNVPV
ncbi:MAG: hypothetical protein DHS20C16_00660 [Phycisphaerae bacterium]|nr:MAG: hypothetical protein DHS20C16_00660 [Phycisphaerae bacterium]